MARKTSTRKPAARRRAPAKGKPKAKSSFGTIGWLAAATLGLGWMASDGRPLAYVQSQLSPEAPIGRIAAQPARTPPVRHAEVRQPAVAAPPTVVHAPRVDAVPAIRVAALPPVTVTPRPAPRLGPMKMPREPAPTAAGIEAPTAPRPIAVRAAAPVEMTRLPINPAVAPAGSEHHATRRLEMHAAPDASARVLASIDSGTEVHVLRAEGPWRYVASAAGRSEGWVDGTYLAGEASALPASPAPRQDAPARDVVAAAILAPFSPTEDRQNAGARRAEPRTRLPPAAIARQ